MKDYKKPIEITELNKKIEDFIFLIRNEDNFLINLEIHSKGYVFTFPEWGKIRISVSYQVNNFLQTTSIFECVKQKNTFDDLFYILDKKTSIDNWFSEKDGIEVSNLYTFVKLCCEKLNLTLCPTLDVESVKEIKRNEEEKKRLSNELVRDKELWTMIDKDEELINLFNSEFNIPSFLVLDSFLWALGNNKFKTKDVIDEVRAMWEKIPNKESKEISMYLPLISKYVHFRLSGLEWK